MRPTICRECYTIMEGSAWPLCEACTDKRITQAVATPLDIPVLWDDLEKNWVKPDFKVMAQGMLDDAGLVWDPEGKVYGDQDDVPTVPTGTTPPLSALAPPKPYKHKRVPTIEERADWFHHTHTTVAEQVGRGPSSPSLVSRIWALLCKGAARVELVLMRVL